MKIQWARNPLATKVILNDHDREVLKLEIELEMFRWNMAEIVFDIGRGSVGTIRAIATRHYNQDRFRSEIEGRFEQAIMDLQNIHFGDCVCQACSCGKCRAEHLVGIDTIKGLKSHPASHINVLFDDGATIREAVHTLETADPTGTFPGWEAHADRWREEYREAGRWLRAYGEQHFDLRQEEMRV